MDFTPWQQLLTLYGSKVTWEREPSVERLGEEVPHRLNVIGLLANFYQVDLDTLYTMKATRNEL